MQRPGPLVLPDGAQYVGQEGQYVGQEGRALKGSSFSLILVINVMLLIP